MAAQQGREDEARAYYERALAGLVILSGQEVPALVGVLSASVARQFELAEAKLRALQEEAARAERRERDEQAARSARQQDESTASPFDVGGGESITILRDAPEIDFSLAAKALRVSGEDLFVLADPRREQPRRMDRREVLAGDRDSDPLGEVSHDHEQFEYCAAAAGLAAALMPLVEETLRDSLLSVADTYCKGSDAAVFPLLELLAAARRQGQLPERWRQRLEELLEKVLREVRSDFYFGRPYTGLALRVAAAGDVGWARKMLEQVERRQPFYPSEFAREVVLADLARAHARLGDMHAALRVARSIGGGEQQVVALADILRIDRARREAAAIADD